MRLANIPETELKAIYDLAELCGQSREDIRYIVNTSFDCKVIGLFDIDTLVAYGIVDRYTKEDKSVSLRKFGVQDYYLHNAAMLAGCAVHESYRGNNLQKRLILAREEYALSVGSTSMLVTVAEKATASKVNLSQSGYEVLASRVDKSKELRYLMRKKLS